MYHYDMCGLDNVYLVNGFKTIKTSEGKAVSIHKLDDLHHVIADKLVKMPRRLTGKEFRFLRIELDMSQKTIGELMGKKDQSIAKWEKGELTLPKLADVIIRQLYTESVGSNSRLRSIFDGLNELDRSIQKMKMHFEEGKNGWQDAA